MGLFQTLKDRIFGSDEAKAEETAVTSAPAPATTAAPAAPKAAIDVNKVLTHMAAKKGQPLNWQTSIVDLMKLVGMDSSLANRKEMAQELGYTGALDGSAEMNLWLHRKVMDRLAKIEV